ncbi:hypothetical protein EDD21DRAFT_429237 [Dissophora ornata]|nr:hypothetical protein EDD21DRAFT_429237 [Dissophora ornata]
MDKYMIHQPTGLNYSIQKKTKLIKKINLLRNPFSDSHATHRQGSHVTTTNSFDKNPFSDRHGMLNADDHDDDDSDEGRNEERILQARRDTLAALDPTNKGSRTAEFKTLRAQPPNGISNATQQHQHELSDSWDQNQQLHQYMPPPLPYEEQIFGATRVPGQILNGVSAPPQSFHVKSSDGNDRDSTLATVGVDVEAVPEIAISMATPSPPLSKNHYPRRSSQAMAKPPTLSSPFTPSLVSKPSLGLASHPTKESDLPPIGATKAKSHRYSSQSKNFFQRITSSYERDSSSVKSEPVEDHIGVEMDKDPAASKSRLSSWSLKRNTFGAPTLQSNQQQRKQLHRDSRLSQKQSAKDSALDPWESGEDILMQGLDDDKGCQIALRHQGELSLKGRVGGWRMNEDTGATLTDRELRDTLKTGQDQMEDWMLHPRTAAARSTFYRVQNDAVPVPNKSVRTQSLTSEYITVSLASPPTDGSSKLVSKGGPFLSRGGSLDSSFYKLNRGASCLLRGLGSVSAQADLTVREADESIRHMVNGYADGNSVSHDIAAEQEERPNYRSSSATFGLHRSSSTPLPATFPSFSSFQDLISSAAGLSRSSSVSGDNMSPPSFTSEALIRRSQTTEFAGHHEEFQLGTVPRGRVSFSPASRRKRSPAMVPTIVIPQHFPDERSAQSATTVSYTPSSASSSVTMVSSRGHLDKHARDEEEYVGMSDEDLEVYGLRSAIPGAFQQLAPQQKPQQVQQEGLLRVPEPARTLNKSQSNALAMAAMTAARCEWDLENGVFNRSLSLASADSLMGPLTSDDYIGQFERERAQARHGGAFGMEVSSTSSTLLTTTVRHGISSMDEFRDNAGKSLRKKGGL